MALPRWVRDTLVLVAIFAVFLGALYVYTGTWPPAVIVESGSMMHADNEVSYGRIGTIDPGDLVLVKRVGSVEDVQTLVEGGPTHDGKAGDVIVYFPSNDRARTPIIHRAVAYVEILGDAGNPTGYRVRWNADAPCEGGAAKDPADAHWCVYDRNGILIPSVPVDQPQNRGPPRAYRPVASGFMTKGDNPATNAQTDEVAGISPAPVPLAWIEGKARGELPWLGLVKLALAGRVNEPNAPGTWTHVGSAYAPKDLWVCLAISLTVIIGGPLAYDGYKSYRERRTQKPPQT